jgi:5-methylcytosine-specific restriction endonuclease McrA
MKMSIRKKLPKALRQQTWLKYIGEKFETKCFINWCSNKINPFNFEVGHNLPVSKGGSDSIDNLRPICSQCNKSMSNKYTIDEFIKLGNSEEIVVKENNKFKEFIGIICCCCILKKK